MWPENAVVRILTELTDGLWHTTHPERFLGALDSGALLPEPDIPNAERFGTGQGPKNYPYVRHIGGVSLFDFDGFDPETYSAKYPVCSWRHFVPYREIWGGAVWVEIDRQQSAPQLVSGPDLLANWKSGDDLGHNIMPIIEAAHVGPLPSAAFRRVLLIRASDQGKYQELAGAELDRAAWDKLLDTSWRGTADANTTRDSVRAAYYNRAILERSRPG